MIAVHEQAVMREQATGPGNTSTRTLSWEHLREIDTKLFGARNRGRRALVRYPRTLATRIMTDTIGIDR